MLINIISFSPLSLSPPSGDFLGLIDAMLGNIISCSPLSLSRPSRDFSKSCGGAMLRNIVSCSLSPSSDDLLFSSLS